VIPTVIFRRTGASLSDADKLAVAGEMRETRMRDARCLNFSIITTARFAFAPHKYPNIKNFFIATHASTKPAIFYVASSTSMGERNYRPTRELLAFESYAIFGFRHLNLRSRFGIGRLGLTTSAACLL
jgi:hypothetical protein